MLFVKAVYHHFEMGLEGGGAVLCFGLVFLNSFHSNTFFLASILYVEII